MTENFTENISCPICGEDKFAVLQESRYPVDLSRDRLVDVFRSSSDTKLLDQLVSCSGCNLIYLNPRISSDIIIDSYAGGHDPRFAAQNAMRIRSFRKCFRNWLRHFGVTASSDRKALDIGCAAGAFPKVAHEFGFSAVGVEPSLYLSQWAREEYKLDIRSGTLQEQNFPDREFDLVTLWDVIEHLGDPPEVLNEISKILKDDGYLIVNFPAYDSWPRKLMGMKWPFFLSVHLFYFTIDSISALLEKCGYFMLDARPYYQTLELGYILERATHIFPLLRFPKRIVDLLGLGGIPITYYLGQTLVTARKR